MNISKIAALTGMSSKMIRYYEQIGLLPKASRSAAGYRRYSHDDVARLNFVYQARQLGFALEDIKTLIQLRQDQQRHSADVKQLAEQHVGKLKQKIAQMQTMVDQLQQLISCCAGDDGPDCAILEQIQSPVAKTRLQQQQQG